MVDVSVTKKWKNKKIQAGNASYIIQSVSSSTTPTTPTGTIPDPTVIAFYGAAPTVTEYNTKYLPIYGTYPRITLLMYDEDNNQLELPRPPLRIITEGVLTELRWDLDSEYSGLIVISK